MSNEVIDLDVRDVSSWFELSYAHYLTIPRSVLEAMPQEWQVKFTALLDELDNTLDWRPQEGRYWVQLRDDNGRYQNDPFCEYRHPVEIPRVNLEDDDA